MFSRGFGDINMYISVNIANPVAMRIGMWEICPAIIGIKINADAEKIAQMIFPFL